MGTYEIKETTSRCKALFATGDRETTYYSVVWTFDMDGQTMRFSLFTSPDKAKVEKALLEYLQAPNTNPF